MEDVSTVHIVALAGFAAGFVFGAVANKTNFCTMGSLSDIVFMQDYNRFRAWLLAIAVALIGTQVLAAMEVIDLSQSIYLTPSLGWFGAVLGGLLFGFGMTMAGGCANKNLVRIGGGNLKSIVVVIVMGLFAYMTLRGLIGIARVEIEGVFNLDLTEAAELESQSMAALAASLTGLGQDVLRWVLVAVIGGGLLLYCFKDADFRASPRDMLAGLLIGALVPTGWWITGVLGFDDFEPVPLGSFTFVAPAGESLQYLMTFSGATINFGVATVGGVIVGSFLVAVTSRSFRIESFTDQGDMLRHLFGSAIMGIGGVMALGCTVGQGITGMSTLAAGSLIALLSILLGGILGLKYLEEGSLGGAIGALFTQG